MIGRRVRRRCGLKRCRPGARSCGDPCRLPCFHPITPQRDARVPSGELSMTGNTRPPNMTKDELETIYLRGLASCSRDSGGSYQSPRTRLPDKEVSVLKNGLEGLGRGRARHGRW